MTTRCAGLVTVLRGAVLRGAVLRGAVLRGVVLLGVVLLAGCSSAVAPPSDPLAADATYARAMIPHHEQALELAALAAPAGGRAGDPRVSDLARRIDREQVEEVGQLQGLLRSWGQDPSGAAGTAGTAGMAGMAGMADPGTLARLGTLSGPAFDRLWLETMIRHHEGAIAMARGHLAAGRDETLRRFSQSLITAQGREIDAMRAVLASPAT